MTRDICGNDVSRPDGTPLVFGLTDTGNELPAYYRVVHPGLRIAVDGLKQIWSRPCRMSDIGSSELAVSHVDFCLSQRSVPAPRL